MAAYEQGEQPAKPAVDRQALALPVIYHHESEQFILDLAEQSDIDGLFLIFQDVLEQGQTYPQENVTKEGFKSYFFSHYTFVVRLKAKSPNKNDTVVAGFYIKPNFPGRSSHLANYGLLVHKSFRGKGIGNFMVEHCIRLAPLVGFKALYTNLVYATNTASIKTCEKYGFLQVGRVPNAGLLKGLGYVDAFQFYKDVSEDK